MISKVSTALKPIELESILSERMDSSPPLNGTDDSFQLLGPALMMTGGDYAPANFGDAEDMRPTSALFDVGGNGSSTPYTMAVNAMLQKHLEEVKGKSEAILSLRSNWKKRLRDFLSQKNTELLDFLSIKVSSHPTLGRGETLLRKFGNPSVHPSHPSVREFVMDVSGFDILGDINQAFENIRGEGALKDYANQTHLLFNEYRLAGEEALKAQAELSRKLDKLDKVKWRLADIVDLEANEKYDPLLEATEGYLKKVFEECNIEADYKALVEAYRKFALLREIVLTARGVLAQEAEPLCPVCFDESVTYVATPCGHTYCQTCCRKQGTTCFICRKGIKDKVRIYFA